MIIVDQTSHDLLDKSNLVNLTKKTADGSIAQGRNGLTFANNNIRNAN